MVFGAVFLHSGDRSNGAEPSVSRPPGPWLPAAAHLRGAALGPGPVLPPGAVLPPGPVLPPRAVLPSGAGGRDGGDVAAAAAVVVEDDGLLLLLVEQAVRALGLRPWRAGAHPGGGRLSAGGIPVTVFVGLDRPGLCCSRPVREPGTPGEVVLRVGYAARAVRLLAAHRAHRCCDAYLQLAPGPGGAVFVHPPGGTAVETAGLTAREADVLLLLAAGSTTPAVAQRLCVSPATARSHCRSVLRKMGVADRRRLRELVGEGLAGADEGGR